MNKRRTYSAFALVFILLASQQAFAQTRIRFSRGGTSAVVRGKVKGFGIRDYVVSARAGQTMTVRLSSSNQYLNFVIYSINGRPTDMTETTEWSEKLMESGDYVIRVLMMRAGARRRGASASYSLNVSVQ